MARLISVVSMGMVAALTLLDNLSPIFSDFGLTSSILKHVSELRGKGESIAATVLSAAFFRILMCGIVALTFFILSPNISELFKTGVYVYTIMLLAIDVVPVSINSLLNNVLLADGRMKAIALFGVVNTAIQWVGTITLLLAGFGISGIVLSWVISDLALLLMLSIAVHKIIGVNNYRQTLWSVRVHLPPMLKFAAPLFLSSMVSFIYSWYDKAIILAYLSLTDLGIYNALYNAFSVIALIAAALGSSLIPFYGMSYGKKDYEAICSGVRRASKYMMLIIFPLAFGLAATAKPTLTLFVGSQYQTGWIALAILSLFGIVFGISPSISNILLIYGKTKTILLLSFIPVVLSFSMLPLVWAVGLIGLAFMRGFSIVLSFLLTAYCVNKLVKIRLDWRTLTRTILSSAIMASIVFIIQQIIYSKDLMPLYILSGVIIYLISLRILNVLNDEDFQLIKQIAGEKIALYAKKILSHPSKSTLKISKEQMNAKTQTSQ